MQGASLLRRVRVEIAPRVGQKALHGAWAQLVSEAMVRSTRFDPLHQAASEQQLHLRLPGWLESLAAQDAIEVSIDTDERKFTASLRREQFALAAEAYYTQLDRSRPQRPPCRRCQRRSCCLRAQLHCPPCAIGLPRSPISRSWSCRTRRRPRLPPIALDEIGPAEPPALVTALQRRHAVAASQGKPRGGAALPTHVILEGRAHVIDERPLQVGFGEGPGRRLAIGGSPAGISRSHCTLERRDGVAIVRDHSRYGSFVNGERVDGEAVLERG